MNNRQLSLLASLAVFAFAPASNAMPAMVSSHGITVTGGSDVRSLDHPAGHMFELTVSTPSIDPKATLEGNGIRVILPVDYETSGKRYPVLYALHGAMCSFRTFSDDSATEKIVESSELIVVMPDGGPVGFYTDWVDPSVPQKWETYHLKELIPFIDANLRTLPSREGRAIAGMSMGGFGAIHYAIERPDLFTAVASFSGALDPKDLTILASIPAISVSLGLGPGPFGLPIPFFDDLWSAADPAPHADRLRGTATFMYVGGGTERDPAEGFTAIGLTGVFAEDMVRRGAERMDAALTSANVPHTYVNYGVPGKFAYGTCVGTHGGPCASYALMLALPELVKALTPGAEAANPTNEGGAPNAGTALPSIPPASTELPSTPTPPTSTEAPTMTGASCSASSAGGTMTTAGSSAAVIAALAVLAARRRSRKQRSDGADRYVDSTGRREGSLSRASLTAAS